MADERDTLLESKVRVAPGYLQPLLEGAHRLYASKKFTDVLITCGGRVWQAHKFCLCAQSAYFQELLGETIEEAEEGKVNFDNEDPQVIEALLHCKHTAHRSYKSCAQQC